MLAPAPDTARNAVIVPNDAAQTLVPPIVRVRDLSVAYGETLALEAVSFDVLPGERVAVIGANGAGKSSLFGALFGLLPVQTGSISAPPVMGYVPQAENIAWDFPVTVRDVVMMGRTRQIGWLRFPRRADWALVDAALARVGLADYATRQIGALSGGQRRRAFIARALAQEARVLVLDEPFSGVDVGAQAALMEVLDTLTRDGITILLSTHDLDLAFHRFDKVLALRRRLVAFGTPDAVYTPDVLTQMYGGRVALVDGALFVDEHKCC